MLKDESLGKYKLSVNFISLGKYKLSVKFISLGKYKLSPESEKNGWVDFMGMLLHPQFPVPLRVLLGSNSPWPLFCNHLVESWEKSWEDERRIHVLVEKGGISWSQLDKTDTQKLESIKLEASGGQVIILRVVPARMRASHPSPTMAYYCCPAGGRLSGEAGERNGGGEGVQ